MAGLTVGVAHNRLLLTIILLPFYVPILIFSTGAVNHLYQINVLVPLMYLLIILILVLMAAPIATAAMLRLSIAYDG